MNTTKRYRGRKGRIGRPAIHAAYSMTAQDTLLAEHPYLRAYLEEKRAAIVRDLAGSEDELSGQQAVIIDSIISRLKKRLVVELYFERCGLFNQGKLKENILELQPATAFYLSLCAGIDRSLIALGLDKRKLEPILTPWQIAAEIDEQKAAKAKGQGEQAGAGEKAQPGAVEGHSEQDPDDEDGQGESES